MEYREWSKRDAIKNYFPLPNEIFCLGLKAAEVAVYAYLLYRENRETFQCHPSYNTIGKDLKMTTNTVRKHVAALEEKRLITTEPTTIRDKNGRFKNGNLLYTIRPIQGAVDYYNEMQVVKAEAAKEGHRVEKKLEELRQRNSSSEESGARVDV